MLHARFFCALFLPRPAAIHAHVKLCRARTPIPMVNKGYIVFNILFSPVRLKTFNVLVLTLLFSAASLLFAKPALATTTVTPDLTWQRTAENVATIITETGYGQAAKLQAALDSGYLDPSQTVFDNGTYFSTASTAGSWASWPHNYPCLQSFELRNFRATFSLSSTYDSTLVEDVKLISPYYAGDIFPINDNAYIYVNGHQVAVFGTHYGAASLASIFETDGVYGSGDFSTTPAQYLQAGTNTIDIVTEETCGWGGMDKVDLVLTLSAPFPSPVLTTSSSSSGSSGGVAPPAAKVCPVLNYVVPVIIESKRVSPTSVSITWGPYSGIDTFSVRYSLTNGDWPYNTNVTGFSTAINALPPNQPIWIQVAVTDNCSIADYGGAKLVGEPSLPNTEFVNSENNAVPSQSIPAQIPTGNDQSTRKNGRAKLVENNIPWYIPLGVLIAILVASVLIQKKRRHPSKRSRGKHLKRNRK